MPLFTPPPPLPLSIPNGGTSGTTSATARAALGVGFITVADEAALLLLTGYPEGIEVKRTDNGFRYTLNNAASPSSTASWQAIPKVYEALLTQSGTDAPVATVLENTLGVVPVWSYADVGSYPLTSAGLFLSGKVAPSISGLDGAVGAGGGAPLGVGTALYRVSDNALSLNITDGSGAAQNDQLVGYPVRALIYP